MIYGLLNADIISDNTFVYCAIPFGHYMGIILSLSINTPVQSIAWPVNVGHIDQFWLVLYNQSINYRILG